MTEETPEVIDIQPQQLASVQARLGSFLLDVALMVVTLFVGWVIWNLFTSGVSSVISGSVLNLNLKFFCV